MDSELEAQLRDRTDELIAAEKALAEEYLLLMGSGNYQTWQAQKMAEFRRAAAVRKAQAEYEIALARLKRA